MTSTMAARVVAFGMAILSVVVRLAMNALQVFNFGALGGLCIFGGARLKGWQAYLLPIVLMAGTDLVLAYVKADSQYGLFHWSRISTYASFAIYVFLGQVVVGESKNPFRIGAAAFLGTAQFFLITNFAAWLRLPEYYTRDFAGLMQSYAAGVPYLGHSLAGDLIFASVAFGAHAILVRDPKPVDEPVAA